MRPDTASSRHIRWLSAGTFAMLSAGTFAALN
jgi:hypothetical protein